MTDFDDSTEPRESAIDLAQGTSELPEGMLANPTRIRI